MMLARARGSRRRRSLELESSTRSLPLDRLRSSGWLTASGRGTTMRASWSARGSPGTLTHTRCSLRQDRWRDSRPERPGCATARSRCTRRFVNSVISDLQGKLSGLRGGRRSLTVDAPVVARYAPVRPAAEPACLSPPVTGHRMAATAVSTATSRRRWTSCASPLGAARTPRAHRVRKTRPRVVGASASLGSALFGAIEGGLACFGRSFIWETSVRCVAGGPHERP